MDTGEPKPGATPLDSSGAKLSRTDLPKKIEFIAEGSMGKMSRAHYQDGSTRVFKNARNPTYNRNLRDEYTIMLILADDKKAPSVPRVYDEFPAQNQMVDTYGFSMEDLRGYRGLLDLQSQTDLTVSLDTNEKMLILLEVCQALQYANSQGIVYNDVQLQNIMTNGNRTKLVDWGNAVLSNKTNPMNDVEQTAALLPRLFNEVGLIPPSMQQWLTTVNKGQYKEPGVAWVDFRRYWDKAFTEEIPPVEQRRKAIFGSANKSTQ